MGPMNEQISKFIDLSSLIDNVDELRMECPITKQLVDLSVSSFVDDVF